MIYRLLTFSCLVVLLTASGCSAGHGVQQVKTNTAAVPSASGTRQGILTVYAAASLTEAFTELGKAFETHHPGMQISFSFAGSQVLRTQLEQGAQADIYASADKKNMDLLVNEGLVAENSAQIFAKNKLVVILPASNPGGVISFADLAKPGLKLVLADASVPAGNYARQVLQNLGKQPGYGSDFATKALGNVVSNETDVRQVVTKVLLGEADAGMVYTSDAISSPGLISIPIPDSANVVAQYPIAVLRTSQQPELAQEFVDYVLSTDGQSILEKWGFNAGK